MNSRDRQSREAETRAAPPGSTDPELREMMQRATGLHREGRIDQAVVAYEAVLVREPRHADALQFMGVAKMQAGLSDEAIGLLKKAVAADPANSQANYNLGLALRAEGREQKALVAFRRAIAVEPRNFEAHNAIAAILLGAADQLDMAEAHIRRAINNNPNYVPALNNLALLLKARGRPQEALREARSAVAIAPQHATALTTLGSLLLELGETEEAEKILRDAVILAPEDSGVYANLGLVLKFIGLAVDAEAAFERALELDPENTEKMNHLALIRSEQGRQDEAAVLLEHASAQKPGDATLHASLGTVYHRQQKWGESITCFRRALDLDGNNLDRAQGFADSLRGGAFLQANAQLWKDLERCLKIEGINHEPLAVPAARLLRNSQQLAPLVEAVRCGDLGLSATEVQKGDVLAPLCTEFVSRLMHNVIIPDATIEQILAAIRRSLLKLAVAGRLPERLKQQTLNFLCTLASQCFLNEYVYLQSAEEEAEVASLQAQIDDRLRQPEERPPRAAIAVLASYRSLDGLATNGILAGHEMAVGDDAFSQLITQQIRNTMAERKLAPDLAELGENCDEPLTKVRPQYDENPYPRWTSIARFKAMSVRAMLGDLFPYANLSGLNIPGEPDLLVAGCGTGAQAVAAASRYRNSRVLAMDPSLASLAYGKRQAAVLGVDHIEWARGDILALAGFERRFDIIDCVGVLHLMREPMAGWRTLRNLLKPGGAMKVGLYSELARADFNQLGADLAALENPADRIRSYRHEIIALPDDAPLKRVMALRDFYTLSQCRDLLFHVEEHRFNLPEIARSLDELDLEFIGFEMCERTVVDRYRARFPNDPGALNLDTWNRFEIENPHTFVGMYQFWVKPRGVPTAGPTDAD